MKNYVYFDCHVFPPKESRAEERAREINRIPKDEQKYYALEEGIGFYSCKNFPGSEFEFAYPDGQWKLRKVISNKAFQNEVNLLIQKYLTLV